MNVCIDYVIIAEAEYDINNIVKIIFKFNVDFILSIL